MKCSQFSKWLEERDVYDFSEADQALKHASMCPDCGAKLRVDEQLDKLVSKALRQKEKMPGTVRHRVDLSLDRMPAQSSRFRYGFYGLLSAALAVMVIFVFASFLTPSLPTLGQISVEVAADHRKHDDSVLVVREMAEADRLVGKGFRLEEALARISGFYSFVGARICPIAGCDALHVVFRDKSGKRLSLFVVSEGDVGFDLSENGKFSISEQENTIDIWKQGAFIYALVG